MKSEKPAILLALLALLDCFALAVACIVFVASPLFFVCFGWVVLLVVAFFPFGLYDKKKGRTVLARPLFVRGLLSLCFANML